MIFGKVGKQMKKNKGGKAAATISIMAIIIMAAKVMGLLRETLVARLYGQGMESDIPRLRFRFCFLIWCSVLPYYPRLSPYLINI